MASTASWPEVLWTVIAAISLVRTAVAMHAALMDRVYLGVIRSSALSQQLAVGVCWRIGMRTVILVALVIEGVYLGMLPPVAENGSISIATYANATVNIISAIMLFFITHYDQWERGLILDHERERLRMHADLSCGPG